VEALNLEVRHGPALLAGGGSKCRFWRELLGEMLGTTPSVQDASPATGAARLAAAAATTDSVTRDC
jgi:sugar (pentulose or hexulose) kinase